MPVEPPVLQTLVISFIAVVNSPGLTVAFAATGAVPSTAYIVPATSASVTPINEPAAGLKPTSLPITEGGTSVIVVLAKIEKLAAVPRLGEVAASATGDSVNIAINEVITPVFKVFLNKVIVAFLLTVVLVSSGNSSYTIFLNNVFISVRLSTCIITFC
jgi:hypothetical protein